MGGEWLVSNKGVTVTSIQPELWVENARDALDFYSAAFGATVLHLGDGDEIVAQLGVGEAAFLVAPASSTMKRLALARSMALQAGRCSWWTTPTPWHSRLSAPARRRRHPSGTSTVGGSAGSSTRSATSGRSASHSVPGPNISCRRTMSHRPRSPWPRGRW